MNAKLIVAIVLGGALGALTRFYISGILPVYKDFPVGTLLVNSIASFLLGYLYGLFLGTGFCGALSTFHLSSD